MSERAFQRKMLSASEYILALHSPEDRVAVLVRNRVRGQTIQRILAAEARISRIGAVDQRDFILPMPFWTPGLNSAFDRNMVLGEDNILYATNGILLVRFDTQTGLADWVRHPPAGVIRLDHATAGGGVLVTNAGELTYFTAKGDGFRIPWSEKTEDLDDIGVIQTDVFDHTLEAPLILREINLFPSLGYLGVEEGASKGHGGLMFLSVQ